MWTAILRNPETLLGSDDRILDCGALAEFKVDQGSKDAGRKVEFIDLAARQVRFRSARWRHSS